MKRFKMILAALLCGALIVGCAPKKTEATPSSAAPASSAEATEGSTAATEGAEGTQVVSFWKWIPTEGYQTDELVNKFKEIHPEIKMDVLHIGESESYFQKLSAALQAGEAPSVLALQPGARATQYKEFCEPLKPMAEARWGADWESKFLPVALEQCRYSGDEYTILPGGMTATPVIQFNAGVFDKHNLKTPETMEDVYNAIETLRADSQIIPGVGIGAKEGWTCRDVFMGIINQVAPGKVYEAQEGKAKFTDPEFIEALNIWKELFDKGFFAEGSLGAQLYPDINDNFGLAGSTGDKYYVMDNVGTWHGSSMTKMAVEDGLSKGTRAEDLSLGAFTLPPVKEGAEKNMVSTVDIAWGVNNSKDQAEKDAAFHFVAFMSAEEGQVIWSNTLQVLPCAIGVDLTSAMEALNGEPEREAVKMFQHYVENSVGARELRYAELANAMNDILPGVAGGMMTPEQAVEILQAASDSITR